MSDPRDPAKLDAIRQRLKVLLVDSLALEDVTAEDIADDEVLFGGGLGLDSLDAVEIVVMLQRNFQMSVQNMEDKREVFQDLTSLACYVYDETEGHAANA